MMRILELPTAESNKGKLGMPHIRVCFPDISAGFCFD